MKKFIRIQSTQDIQVTGGLDSIDVTRRDQKDFKDRLNVQPAWVGKKALIRKGTFIYPSELKTWDTVKSLVASGILTLGEETDECNDEEVIKLKESLEKEAKRYAEMARAAEEDRIAGKSAPKKEEQVELKF